jgi:hypothetical protein
MNKSMGSKILRPRERRLVPFRGSGGIGTRIQPERCGRWKPLRKALDEAKPVMRFTDKVRVLPQMWKWQRRSGLAGQV